MSQVITKRVRLSRRSLLKGLTASGSPILVGLPPVSMFNSLGTAYAAAPPAETAEKAIESRFVLWFNGNGIPERYWIPSDPGADYRMTPCLSPLAPFRADFHVLSGVDNAAAGGMGNGHTNSMSGLMTGHAPYRAGTAGAVNRPVDRHEDRRRLALRMAVIDGLGGACLIDTCPIRATDSIPPSGDVVEHAFLATNSTAAAAQQLYLVFR